MTSGIGHNRPRRRPVYLRAWSEAEFHEHGWRGKMDKNCRGTTSGDFTKRSPDGRLRVRLWWRFSRPCTVYMDIFAPSFSVSWKGFKGRTIAARCAQAIIDDYAADPDRLTRERTGELIDWESYH